MVHITDELELILRLGPEFNGDFDALVEAAQGDGWEADDARWMVTRRLGEYEVRSAALYQVEIWDARGVQDLLAEPLLELFATWLARGKSSVKFQTWTAELVHDLTSPQLLRLAAYYEITSIDDLEPELHYEACG